MLDIIKDFFESVLAFFMWLFTMCLSGIYVMGAFALAGITILGAFAIPLLPLIVGIWLISLLF